MDDFDLDKPVYGARAIGRVMGLSEAQAFHALEGGRLDANKFGGKWMSTVRRLRSTSPSQLAVKPPPRAKEKAGRSSRRTMSDSPTP
jgi:hypothetical protein